MNERLHYFSKPKQRRTTIICSFPSYNSLPYRTEITQSLPPVRQIPPINPYICTQVSFARAHHSAAKKTPSPRHPHPTLKTHILPRASARKHTCGPAAERACVVKLGERAAQVFKRTCALLSFICTHTCARKCVSAYIYYTFGYMMLADVRAVSALERAGGAGGGGAGGRGSGRVRRGSSLRRAREPGCHASDSGASLRPDEAQFRGRPDDRQHDAGYARPGACCGSGASRVRAGAWTEEESFRCAVSMQRF